MRRDCWEQPRATSGTGTTAGRQLNPIFELLVLVVMAWLQYKLFASKLSDGNNVELVQALAVHGSIIVSSTAIREITGSHREGLSGNSAERRY
ncbi:hypothetical protein WG66_000702 [Moniliophthora roreri]|nr:hypothetical protein WG66_000702 [Moniliophthora roreri]